MVTGNQAIRLLKWRGLVGIDFPAEAVEVRCIELLLGNVDHQRVRLGQQLIVAAVLDTGPGLRRAGSRFAGPADHVQRHADGHVLAILDLQPGREHEARRHGIGSHQGAA